MASVNGGSARFEVDYREFNTAAAAGDAASRVPHRLAGVDTTVYDVVYSKRLSLTTTPTDIDLTALPSQLGGANRVLATLHVLAVKHVSGAGTAQIGADATAPADLLGGTDTLTIPVQPGGWAVVDYGTAGRTVTDTTADVLQLVASAGTVVVDVVIAGNVA